MYFILLERIFFPKFWIKNKLVHTLAFVLISLTTGTSEAGKNGIHRPALQFASSQLRTFLTTFSVSEACSSDQTGLQIEKYIHSPMVLTKAVPRSTGHPAFAACPSLLLLISEITKTPVGFNDFHTHVVLSKVVCMYVYVMLQQKRDLRVKHCFFFV